MFLPKGGDSMAVGGVQPVFANQVQQMILRQQSRRWLINAADDDSHAALG
jgi:hypothetical protein